MEKLRHLWNIANNFSTDAESENNLRLQSYYISRCRQLQNDAEPSNKVLGPSAACSHCGLLWSKVNHRVRLSSSRRPGKSVKKLMRHVKDTERKPSRYKETLAKKVSKNRGNKLVIRCSFCSKDTEINLSKPARLKPTVIAGASQDTNDTPIAKKRKKRTKDKTAGLTIAGNRNSTGSSMTPKLKPKSKPTNVTKLGAMIAKNITPSKKSSLHDFIMELG